jgi:hypothetical protein
LIDFGSALSQEKIFVRGTDSLWSENVKEKRKLKMERSTGFALLYMDTLERFKI